MRQTLTVDNGKEFAGHDRLSARLEMPVYFAHAYSSNERATNENTNGLLRQYFPKGTDFRDIPHHELAFVTRRLNNRPRKRLNYLTPCEVLNKTGIALQGARLKKLERHMFKCAFQNKARSRTDKKSLRDSLHSHRPA